MPRLSHTHDQARRRIIDLANSGLPAVRLASQISTVLQEVIGWDGFRLFGLDPQTLLVNSLLAASENDADARLEWLREVYLALPTQYAELSELARSGSMSVAFQERQSECWGFSGRQLADVSPDEHYRQFHAYRSPVGGTILSVFHNQRQPFAAVQAYRRDPKRQFRRSDVQFMHQMSGTIGTALAVAQERDNALGHGTASSPMASGIMMVTDRGEVQFATPATEQWLARLGPRDGQLPAPIWSAMAAFRVNQDAAAAVVSVPTSAGRIRVEVSTAGDHGLRAVVLAAEAPPTAPHIPSAWGLTRRETEVVEQLANGRSNREMSDVLFVGEHTVEWHLRSVYDKLGVRSRQEVVALLFHQTMLPAIELETLAATG